MNSTKLKPLCRTIISNYTTHVRNAIRAGREEYEATGIDLDIGVYRSFFLNMLGLALGLEDTEPKINTVVKYETLALLRHDLGYRKYHNILTNNRQLIYTTCVVLFDKVVTEMELQGMVMSSVK